MRWITIILVVTASAGGIGARQEAPVDVNPRSLQLRQLAWQKSVLLAMADSMPEHLYRDKVTPEQRDFAQQLLHSAGLPWWVCHTVRGLELPVVDTAAVLNSAEALKGFVTETFEFCEEVVRNWSEEDRKAPDPLAGDGVVAPKAELLDQAYLHTAYTLGQVVANFRKHGMAPPGFPPF